MNKIYKIGEIVKNGDFEVIVNLVEIMKFVGLFFVLINVKGIFVVVDVMIKNKGKEVLIIDSFMFKLKFGDKIFEVDNIGLMFVN